MAKPKTKWPVIAGIVFIVGFIAAMAYSTFGNNGFRCEVCMTYNGRTICRNGAGANCTDLSHGMTELVQCQNSQAKVTWK